MRNNFFSMILKGPVVLSALMVFIGCASTSAPTETLSKTQTPKVAKRLPQSVLEGVSGESEWKGACRKFLDDSGHEAKRGPFKRFQDSYLFQAEKVIWSVWSFRDNNCQVPVEINKISLICGSDPIVANAKCVQNDWEVWQGSSWQRKPFDPDEPLRFIYTLELLTEEKARLKSKGESELEQTELLSRELDQPQ